MHLAQSIANQLGAGIGARIETRNASPAILRITATYQFQQRQFTIDSAPFGRDEARSLALPRGASDILFRIDELVFRHRWATLRRDRMLYPINRVYRISGRSLNLTCSCSK